MGSLLLGDPMSANFNPQWDYNDIIHPTIEVPPLSFPTQVVLASIGFLSPHLHREQVSKRIEELRYLVDRIGLEINALQDSRDAVSAARRLPPEVLYRIFLDLASFTRDEKTVKGRLSWMNVTQVCRFWRAVAIDSPESSSLWTHLTFEGSPSLSEEMIRRSGLCPLSISVRPDSKVWDVRSPNYAQYKAFVSSPMYASRLRSVELRVRSTANLQEIQIFPSTVTFTVYPQLERFVLVLRGDQAPTRSTSPPFLLDVDKLKHLRIDGLPFNWKSFSSGSTFSPTSKPYNLTTLNLVGEETALDSRPSWISILQVLGCVPDLEALVLYHLLPLDVPATLADPARLQKLRLLRLCDRAPFIGHFFISVGSFKAEEVRLDIVGRDSHEGLTLRVDHCISNLAKAWLRSQGKTKRLKDGFSELRIYDLDTDPTFRCWYEESDAPHLVLRCYISDPDPTIEPSNTVTKSRLEFMEAILDQFYLTNLETLHVSRAPIPRSAWIRHFGRLLHLESIHFSDNHTFCDFISALTPDVSGSPSEQLFPALSIIKCFELDFDLERKGDVAVVHSLAEALSERSEDLVVPELHVEQCINFAELDYDYLDQEYEGVLTVVWDGYDDDGGYGDSDSVADSESNADLEEPQSWMVWF